MADSDLRGRRLGEFLLQEELDRGAYGVVYRAEQPALGRDVVVKVLQRDVRDQDAMRRFLREAQVASVLDHPYAAHVYAFGVDDVTAKPWIAMELVKGVTLARWSSAHGPMPLERLVPLFGCVAEVVQAAHDQGIVHRDLKPSNIMVVERGERLIPKLLDFGVAKWTQEGIAKRNAEIEVARDDACVGDVGDPVTARVGTQSNPQRRMISLRQLTRDGVGLGSLPYMSPEQIRDSGTAGAASDIYALGVIVYELLTGRRPFVADTADGYQRMHLEAVPPRLDGFSPRVNEIVQHALSKDPDARPRSALDMARELREALQAEPREQLRSLATVWNARQQPRSLLLRDDALHRMETEAQTSTVGELERSFMTESRRDTLRRAKRRRAFAIGAAMAALALLVTGVWADLAHKAELANETVRHARQVAEMTITLASRERGRAALLQGEPDAAMHLARAYRRAPDAATAFMFARALQPLLAEQARLPSSFGRMWSATLSPDESQLVTTDDKNVQIWDAQSYRLRFTLAHGDTVYHAVYSADGARMFTACGDGTVRIWDAHTGALMRELRHEGRALRYRWLSLSPDGAHVAAIDMAGSLVHVWSVNSGTAIAELHNEDGASAFPSVAFSPNGQWLAMSGGKDARVFNTGGWHPAIIIPRVRCLSWAPVGAGARLLTGNVKGDVSLWEVPGGRRVHHLRDIGEAITAVAYAPDGRTVAAASRDGVEYIWDTASGELRNQGNYLHEAIRSVEFDRSSRLTVAAALNGSVAVVDAQQGNPIAVLSGPRNVVASAHFDAEAHRVIGASWDGTVRVWGTAAPYQQWGSARVADSCGSIIALEPDRRIVAVKCNERPTVVWDTIRGKMLAELPSSVPAGGDFSTALPAVSAAGDRAAIARGSTVEVYALPGGKLLRSIVHSAVVNAVAFAPKGLDLVTGAVDGSLLVTRDGGAQIVLPKAPAGIDAAALLPDGRVVAADAHRTLRLYDARGAITATLGACARVFALRMDPDGHRVITLPTLVDNASAPELFDTDGARLIARLDEQGQGQVWGARFVGTYVITASSDGAARRWDAATGELQQLYRGGSRFLADATLSPDGSMIVGGDASGVLRFWDAGSGAPLWTMQAHHTALIGIHMEGDDIVTRGYSGDISRWRMPKPERVIEACGHNERCATVLP